MWKYVFLLVALSRRTGRGAGETASDIERAEAATDASERYVPLKDRELSGRRLLGGQVVDAELEPHALVLLGADGRVRCSGAAVGPQHVLTAAHCTRAGLAYVSRRSGRYARGLVPIHHFHTHPNYSMTVTGTPSASSVTHLHNDIAVVVAYNEFKSPVRPIGLSTANLAYLTGVTTVVMGFGQTSENQPTTQLLEAHVVLRACPQANWTRTVCGFTQKYKARAAACAGDSGGPLVYEELLVGVASLGPARCGSGMTSARILTVFSLVAPHRHWIEARVRAPFDIDPDERLLRETQKVFKAMSAAEDADSRSQRFSSSVLLLLICFISELN